MGDKTSNKDFLSIKEFAMFVGMTESALRHYDKIGAFAPAKRGVAFENQYRYYSPLQITTVKMILVLVEIGVPLKTIKALAKDRTPEMLLKLLRKNRDKVFDEIHFLQEVYSVISTYTELLNESISATETEIIVSQMPEKRILLGGINNFVGETDFIGAFTRFCNAVHEPKLNMSFPIGGYFESMEVFLQEPSRPPRFFSMDPKGYDFRAAGLYLIGFTRGYYGQTNNLPGQMAEFAQRNGLMFNGPVYNIYLTDEVSVVDPEQYLLQVSASVTETRRVPSRRPRRHC